MSVITCIDDLRKGSTGVGFRKCSTTTRRPGVGPEQTFIENTSEPQELHFRQNCGQYGGPVDPGNHGRPGCDDAALVPVGLTGMQWKSKRPRGRKIRVPYTLSTMSICSIEDVAQHTDHPFWFQVYTLKDDDFMRRLMERQSAQVPGTGHHGRSPDAWTAA